MPRLLKIKEFEERRKALAQESDVYRETLKLQIQNLQLYGLQARQKFTSLSPSSPWLMLIAPLLGTFIGRRRFPKMGLITGALFAWKLFKKFGTFLPAIFGRRKRRDHEEEPASAI